MGTGKTSVGAALARRIGRPAQDIDALIEAAEHQRIAQIFAERGEAYFRHLEKAKVAEVSAQDGLIITTGGGAVMDPENVQHLKRNALVIGLEASVETILLRVGRSKNRPLLKNASDPRRAVEELLSKRREHYQRASDWMVATDGQSAEQVAEKIEAWLRQQGEVSSA